MKVNFKLKHFTNKQVISFKFMIHLKACMLIIARLLLDYDYYYNISTIYLLLFLN
jgi:hypothetical protein